MIYRKLAAAIGLALAVGAASAAFPDRPIDSVGSTLDVFLPAGVGSAG